jgi:hypothetical protein
MAVRQKMFHLNGEGQEKVCRKFIDKQNRIEKNERPFKVPDVFPPTYVMAKNQKEANEKIKKVQNGMDRKIASKNLHMIGK